MFINKKSAKEITKIENEEIILPQSIIDSFAKYLVPIIRDYYNSEEGQKEFAK